MNDVEVETEPEVVVSTKRPEPKQKEKPKRQPRYAVVVLNDDLHSFDYVIMTFAKVFGYSLERGFQLASEIHYTGWAIVWTGALEHAELKRDQIQSMGPDMFATQPVTFPLGVDLEPVD